MTSENLTHPAGPDRLTRFGKFLAKQGDSYGAVLLVLADNWRATQRALADAQAENTRLAATADRLTAENQRLANTLYVAAERASQLEAAATSTVNILASGGFHRAVTQGSPA